jgi:hypothetical protein
MGRNAIIPEDYLILGPSDPDLEIRVLANLVEQEGEDRVRLGLGHANDLASEARVDEYTLPSGHGVNAHEGVDSLDLLTANVSPSRTGPLGLGNTAVDGTQVLQVLLEEGR